MIFRFFKMLLSTSLYVRLFSRKTKGRELKKRIKMIKNNQEIKYSGPLRESTNSIYEQDKNFEYSIYFRFYSNRKDCSF